MCNFPSMKAILPTFCQKVILMEKIKGCFFEGVDAWAETS